MNDDLQPDHEELASAYLDGELTDDEANAVEADAEQLARVVGFRAVSEAVGSPVAPLSPRLTEQLISAALGALEEPAEASVTSSKARRSRPKRKIWLPPPAAAAAAILVIAALGIGLILAGMRSDDNSSELGVASSSGTEERATSADAAASGNQPMEELPDLGEFATSDDIEVSLRTVDVLELVPAPLPLAGAATADDGAGETAADADDSAAAQPETAQPETERVDAQPKMGEAPAASIDRCDQVIRSTDSTLGDRLAVGVATVDNRPVLIYSHPVNGGTEAPVVTRLTVADSESCQVLLRGSALADALGSVANLGRRLESRTMADETSNTPSGDDWPAQAADTIVKVVGQVRDRTTGTAITASRGVVYGLLAAILGTVAFVLAFILIHRGLVILIDLLLGLADLDKPGRAVWMANVVMGLGFTLGGLSLWKRANTPAPA